MNLNGLSSQLPRPNRTTVQILLVAALVAGAGWFLLYQPAHKDLDAARAALAEGRTTLERDESLLSAYRNGDIVEGAKLTDQVGTVESLLPGTTTGAGRVFAVLQDSAKARGLTVSDLQVTGEYVKPSGEAAAGYPDVLVAFASMRLSGPTPQLLAFLSELDAYPQLVSYTSSGVSGAPDAPTMQLQLRLWSSKDPEWRNGIPTGGGRDAGDKKPAPSTTAAPKN